MQGGMISVSKGAAGGTAGGGTQLALSDGLACYTGSFSGITTASISHGLDTTDLVVEFKDNLNNLLIPDNWSIINSNTIEIEFASPQIGNLVVIGCVQSGLVPNAGGVLLVEGLSGIIDLDSPNGSIDISTSGQVINLNALFTPASGSIVDQIMVDIITLSGIINSVGPGCFASSFSGLVLSTIEHGLNTTDILVEFKDSAGNLLLPDNWVVIDENNIEVEFASPQNGDVLVMGCSAGGTVLGGAGVTTIEGLSGVVELGSPNGSVDISVDGQTINLEVATSGNASTGVSLDFSAVSGVEFVMQHDLSTSKFIWDMWTTDTTPDCVVQPENVVASGTDHVIITLDAPMAGFINLIGIAV
jgi:hypothetical protein